MYQIKCDENIIYDVRDDELKLITPKFNLEVNTVGSGSFKIYTPHPFYNSFNIRKSIFELSDEIGVVFRGVMTEHSTDINNGKNIDLEGVLGFLNGSIVRPFKFPEDFADSSSYINSTNKVQFFLNWLITNHNSQVPEWQRFRLGTVTVSDPNNYITRSCSTYKNSWETIKTTLFGSSLGGYLCIRYEDDGNYIDYLEDFTLTNTQEITYGENLLTATKKIDSKSTFTAILPLGAEEEEGESSEDKKRVTIESIDDFIQGDIHKVGDTIYSESAVNTYGWIYASVNDATWDDVSEPANLLTKATAKLTGGRTLKDIREIKAADLHFTDSEIRSFRIYRKQVVNAFNERAVLNLTKLSIDVANPQNTLLNVGETKLTLTDHNKKAENQNIERIEKVVQDVTDSRKEMSDLKRQTVEMETRILNDCQQIILEASRDYVLTGNFSEFQERVTAALQVMSDDVSIQINQITSMMNNVNGDFQQVMNDLSKHFDFRVDGMTIKTGSGDDMELRLDNGLIVFSMNGTQFGWWDGVTFHTGNIIVDVDEMAQFGNFAFVPRTDESLSFLKVGG